MDQDSSTTWCAASEISHAQTSSNEAVNAAHGVTTASTQVNTAYSTNIDNLSDVVIFENKKSDVEVSKVVRKSDDSPIIKDWVSNSKEENVSQTKTEKKTVKPSIVKKDSDKSKQQQKLLGKLLNKLSNIGKTLTVQEAIKEIITNMKSQN
ncbi:hypothetical protein Tco_0418689 [Tanacetum coccineum]